jgi:transcription initiation factor TFIIB
MELKIKKCPECGSTNLIYDSEKGEIICANCGLVIEENIVDLKKEWRSFDEGDQSRARATGHLTYTKADQGIGTAISSSQLGKLSQKDRSRYLKLKKWQSRLSSSIEKNLRSAMNDLKKLVDLLKLPPGVEEEAAYIYTLAVQKSLVRGRNIDTIIVASIYIALRKLEIPRTLDEIVKITGIPKKEIGKIYRLLSKELGIKINPINPIDYIYRFANLLHLKQDTLLKAIDLLKEAQNKKLVAGRSATGVAAAVLYIACVLNRERKTQKEIAEIAGVTEVTIRNRYRELAKELGLEKTLSKILAEEGETQKV